jgi:multiple sugar transport system substrate-binding protein
VEKLIGGFFMKKVLRVGVLLFMVCIVGHVFAGGSSQTKRTELTFIEYSYSALRTEAFKAFIAQYESLHPNIKVNLISPPYEQAQTRILMDLQAGNPLDVIECGGTELLASVPNGWLVDLTPYYAKWEDAKTLLSSVRDAANFYFGKPYHIPLNMMGAAKNLFIRTDVVAKAGITKDPASMQELYELCVRITNTAANQYGYAFRGKGLPVNHYVPWTLHEVPNIDPDNWHFLKNGASVYSSPEFLAALKRYIDLYRKAAPADSVNWGFNEQLNGFVSGVTPYLMQDPDAVPSIAEYLTPEQFKVIPAPLGNAKTLLSSGVMAGLALSSSSKNKDEAWEFMAWLSAPTQNAEYAKASGFLPIYPEIYESDAFFSGGFYKAWADIVNIPGYVTLVREDSRNDLYLAWPQRHEADLQAVLLGQKTPEEICAAWTEYWKR